AARRRQELHGRVREQVACEEPGLVLLCGRHGCRGRCGPALCADVGRPGKKPSGAIKLVSQLLDLPLIDHDNRWCGVVDDVELEGSAGKETRIKALLVGPGAYAGRVPDWAFWIIRKLAGDRFARVPIDQVERISSAVHLKCPAEKVKLHR